MGNKFYLSNKNEFLKKRLLEDFSNPPFILLYFSW